MQIETDTYLCRYDAYWHSDPSAAWLVDGWKLGRLVGHTPALAHTHTHTQTETHTSSHAHPLSYSHQLSYLGDPLALDRLLLELAEVVVVGHHVGDDRLLVRRVNEP